MADVVDGINVSVCIESDSAKIRAMASEMTSLNAIDEVLRKPYIETTTAKLAAKHGLHATCVVPSGVLKAVEAAAGLALPADCKMRIRRLE